MNILLFTQINNFLSNQTTNERHSNNPRKPVDLDQSEKSFLENDAQDALLRNSSIDSTVGTNERGR
jgi:hypothetical protein